VLTAAIFESPTLPLTVEALLAMAPDEDRRAHIIELFAELCRLDLVCEISPGLFEIAPGPKPEPLDDDALLAILRKEEAAASNYQWSALSRLDRRSRA
jgi:hypothetical protein